MSDLTKFRAVMGQLDRITSEKGWGNFQADKDICDMATALREADARIAEQDAEIERINEHNRLGLRARVFLNDVRRGREEEIAALKRDIAKCEEWRGIEREQRRSAEVCSEQLAHSVEALTIELNTYREKASRWDARWDAAETSEKNAIKQMDAMASRVVFLRGALKAINDYFHKCEDGPLLEWAEANEISAPGIVFPGNIAGLALSADADSDGDGDSPEVVMKDRQHSICYRSFESGGCQNLGPNGEKGPCMENRPIPEGGAGGFPLTECEGFIPYPKDPKPEEDPHRYDITPHRNNRRHELHRDDAHPPAGL